jgi:diguanylate cyclase (GGDEF)-like protein/PAS domain S-box-containing protein
VVPGIANDYTMDNADLHEQARLDALKSYGLLDTPPEGEFDRLTLLASRLCGTPIATVTLVDGTRQWFKSVRGLPLRETARASSFCARAVEGRRIVVVEDATKDPGFARNPLVTGDPGLRFYAGVPLINHEGYAIGTLSVMDIVPRSLEPDCKESLELLAGQAMQLIENRRETRRLVATLESITDAVYMLDHDWRFTYLNFEAERLLLRSRADLLGKTVWNEMPGTAENIFRREYERAVRENCAVAFEEFYPPLDLWLEVRAYPSAEGLAVYFRDVSERRATLEALRESEERFRYVARASTDAVWDWDFKTNAIWWGDGIQTLFGYSPQEIEPGSESWTNRIHPDDLEPVLRGIHAVIDGDGTTIWADEYRFRRKDGTYATVLDRGFVIRDAQQKAMRMVGGMSDLSAAKAAEEEARRSAAVQAGVARAQQELVSSNLDLEAALELVASRARELTGARAAVIELIENGQTVQYALAADDADVVMLGMSIRNGLTGAGSRGGALLHCDDAEFDDRVDQANCRSIGARSVVVCPLMAGDSVIGVVTVLADSPRAFQRRDANNLQILVGSLGTVIQRHRATEQLRKSEAQYRLLFDNNPHPMWVYDKQSLRLLAVNRSAIDHYGYSEREFLSMTLRDLRPPEDVEALVREVNSIGADAKRFGIWRHVRKDGSIIDVEISSDSIDFNGRAARLVLSNDITARKASEQEIKRLAFYDTLTQLPNRLLLVDRLQLALAASMRSGTAGALLFIDLDNFKILNDTLGHDKGDQLLQQVALRLGTCVRATDTVARLGGDEFVIMIEDLGESPAEAAAQARAIAEKVLAAFTLPYQLDLYEHFTSPSIGVALFSGTASSVDELLKRADLAMYQAKSSGRNTIRFFDPEMQRLVNTRVQLESDLRHGLQREEFVLHYQPQIGERGRVVGAEALVRWRHPVKALVSPIEFIPLAEDTGLILPLGHWVLETACRQLARWSGDPATAGLTIAVNVSSRQFRHPDFVGQVLQSIRQTGADPHRLKLELTESLLVEDMDATIEKMGQLKARGVGFSLDDFGTGYSSLAYLKRLPLDQLKIDQSFVRDVLTDPNGAAIARTIVALAQSLGLSVIAEGVETEAQRALLEQHGCLSYQGYLFSPPVPIEQFTSYLQATLGGGEHGRNGQALTADKPQ